jgi:hypothetical protein
VRLNLGVMVFVFVGIAILGCAKEEAIPSGDPAPSADVRAVDALPSPAGAGAAEPFLFATKNGVLLSWLEPAPGTDRVALRFATFDGVRWSPPRTIVERNDLFVNWADFPSVVEDAKGALFAHWLQKSGKGTYSYDVMMASSTDGGATWGSPFLLNRDGKQAEHGFVTLAALPDGGVGATWLDGRNMTAGEGHDHGDMGIRYAEVHANGTLHGEVELDSRTCECCTTGMTMSAAGPVIVYRDRSADEVRDIAWVAKTAAGWSAPKLVHSDAWKINACPVNGPQIDAIGSRVATAWFTAAQDQQRAFVAFSDDGGRTFGKAIRLDDGKPIGRLDVVLLDEEHALVTWLEQTGTGGEIRARRISRQGRVEPAIKIADSGTARAAGFARIARRGPDVFFAWTEQSADSKRIHVARRRF